MYGETAPARNYYIRKRCCGLNFLNFSVILGSFSEKNCLEDRQWIIQLIRLLKIPFPTVFIWTNSNTAISLNLKKVKIGRKFFQDFFK